MNRFTQSAYDLATYVARNHLSGVARDAFDVVDQAASVLASEVREQGYEMDKLRTELRLAQEARCRMERQRDQAQDRAGNTTESLDRYKGYAVLVEALMVFGVITPGVLYTVAPGAVTRAALEMRGGKKINAVKIIRRVTGANLVVVKDWVEDWMAQNAKT